MDVKSNVVRKENAHVEINMEIPVELLQDGYNQELAKFQKNYKMPGFRPGKVPLGMIEKKYKGSIEAEAIETIISKAYSKTLYENRLSPFTRPEFSKFDIDFTKPLNLTVKFDTYPFLELKEYKDLSVAKDSIKVSDDDVEHALKHVQQENAELVPRTEGIKPDDMAVLDLVGFKDGVEDPELKLNNQRFEVKKGLMPDDLYKGLLGMKKDEEKEIAVKYPNDYHSKKIAGQKIDFKVKVNDVLEKKLPELNDEFVKDLGTFQTLEEMKADLRKKLEEDATNKANFQYDSSILEAIAAKGEYGIPDSYINEKIEEQMKSIKDQLKWRNMSLEEYFEQQKTTEAKVKADYKEHLIKDIKKSLAWLEVARKESIKVGQEDFDAHIRILAEKYKLTEDKIREYYSKDDKRENIMNELLFTKTMEFLRTVTKEKKGKQLKYSEIQNHGEEG